MHYTYINRMRIEEVEHVVDPHDGANKGSNSVCHNIDFRDVQSQDGQESWCCQAKSSDGVFDEKMQRVPIERSLAGKRTKIGKQSQDNHPCVFPT